MVSFINIVFGVAKLKIFKNVRNKSESMKGLFLWGFLALTPYSQIIILQVLPSNVLRLAPEVVS